MQSFRFLLAFLTALYCVSTLAAIEEVVVTAQKRAESVQDVPISITAISGEDLIRRGLNNMQDVARAVPNFDLPAANNMRNVSIRIRGIGSTGTNPGIENSVGTFLDGLYMPAGAMSFGELSDIQTIEILRGPQGTLYGPEYAARRAKHNDTEAIQRNGGPVARWLWGLRRSQFKRSCGGRSVRQHGWSTVILLPRPRGL